MQYLLTEDEMAKVIADREALRKLPDPDELEELSKHVACNMIDIRPVNALPPAEAPHGCIHIPQDDGRKPWYCDRCPARGICRLPKDWSK